tara:strand:+ start:7521 stop:7751 length:231 start_codon:yes stop_codon:yes gene_type:complete
MIDTDKYEGHLSDLKEVAETIEQHRATYALLKDAPLLLEAYKRLRDFIQSVWDGLGEAGRNEYYKLFKEYMGEEEE